MALNAQMKGGEKKAKIKLNVDTTNMLMGKRIRSSIVPKAPLRTYWTNLWTTRTTSLDINPVSGLLSKSFLFCEMWFHKLSILEIKKLVSLEKRWDQVSDRRTNSGLFAFIYVGFINWTSNCVNIPNQPVDSVFNFMLLQSRISNSHRLRTKYLESA